MPIFEPSERRQLKLFAWFLLIINVCILGVGSLFGRALENPMDGWVIAGAVALVVNLVFVVVVGGDVLFAVISHWRRGHGDGPPD